MKKIFVSLLFIVLFLYVTNGSASAQIRRYGKFVTTGINDAEQLFEAYMSPYIQGFGSSLSGGWYNTAKTHELGGFDIHLSISGAVVPNADRTYSINDLDVQGLTSFEGSNQEAPTVAGENTEGPLMRYNYDSFTDTAFGLPAGTGIPIVPAPMLQASIGLVKNTDIIGRYMPYVGNDKGKLGFWGVGIKHDIKQWIPGISEVPVFNMSVLVGYTRFKAHTILEVNPGEVNLGDYTDLNNLGDWDNQQMNLNIGSLTSSLLVSADLPVISFYGGVGFIRTKSILELKGDYPMLDIDAINEGGAPEVLAVNDPMEIEFENENGGLIQPRLNAGLRLKLGVICMNFDYTWANYSVATAGIGITFR